MQNLRIDQDIQHVRQLFWEYQAWLGHDITFQHFEAKLAELPGQYALPTGCLLLASYENKPVGCVALRKLKEDICEVKRLFVRTEHRNFWRRKTLSKDNCFGSQEAGLCKDAT